MVTKISKETYLLVMLLIADLVFTVIVINRGDAIEANGLLGFYLQTCGMTGFITAKLTLFGLMPLTAVELLRRQRPIFVRNTQRTGIALYLAIYICSVIFVNRAEGNRYKPYKNSAGGTVIASSIETPPRK